MQIEPKKEVLFLHVQNHFVAFKAGKKDNSTSASAFVCLKVSTFSVFLV